MTKISGPTFFLKRVFPAFWFGLLALLVIVNLDGRTPVTFLIPLMALGGFGFVAFRNLVWDLADEVYDAGDHLVFRKGSQEQRVNLSEIVNIGYAAMSAPKRVTIYVRSGGPIGKELVFTPRTRLGWFLKSPIVSDLIERVDHARRA